MTKAEKQNQQKGFLEYLRINHSIGKIRTIEQFRSTAKWISLFECKYKIADLTCSLRNEMLKVEL
jgi:hypothetical protein